MFYIGIDPGVTGAITCYDPYFHPGDPVVMSSATWTEREATEYLEGLKECERVFAMIEHVDPRPTYWKGKGGPQRSILRSTCVLIQNYGFWRGVLAGLRIPFDSVKPRTWQQAMGCLSPGQKNKSVIRAKAQELFPSAKGINAKTCDSLLIMEYGRRLGNFPVDKAKEGA